MIKTEYGYEYDAQTNLELYKETYNMSSFETFCGAYTLRSGRDAIKVIAREFSHCMALLPSLSCDSMVSPFKMYGHNVVFYKLDSKVKIDLEYLHHILSANANQTILFLYMNYFGIESISNIELQKLKSKYKNLVFINDITHTFLYFRPNEEFEADYTLASLRKWVNIPDGGLLWCKETLKNSTFSEDVSFAYTRLEAQNLKYQFSKNGNEDLKTRYRQIFSNVSSIIDKDTMPSRMTKYSFELIKKVDFAGIEKIRRNNAKALIEILSKCPKIRLIQDDYNVSNLYVPFTIENRDTKQAILSKEGIFNTIIWPISDEQKKTCENAKFIEENMLAAPCDQRYTADDMKYIGREIVRIVNE